MAGNGGMDAAYRAQRGLYMPAEVERLAGPALRDRWASGDRATVGRRRARAVRAAARRRSKATSRASRRASTWARSSLRDLDAMSMAHALEVRVPFVDHVLLGRGVARPWARTRR